MKLTPKYLDGAFLAINALPGVCAVVDAPRCELERAWIFDASHDWNARLAGSGPYARDRRIFAPLWKNRTVVTGTEDVFVDLIRFVAERHPKAPIFLYPSFLSLLVNADLEGIAKSLEDQIDNPLLCVGRKSIEDDWIDGIRHTQTALLKHMASPQGPDRPLIVGFCPSRLEGDETGNVIEIDRLWKGAGFPEPVWPFDGRSSALQTISDRAPLIAFPTGFDESLVDWSGPVIPVDLPIGIGSTCRFLRKLGEHFDRSEGVELLIDEECRQLRPRLAPFVARSLAGKSVALIADPHLGYGLHQAMRELGLDTCLTAILRKRDACDAEALGQRFDGTELWLDPLHQDLEERIVELAAKGLCDALVGSGVLRDAAARVGLPYLEIGAPHFLEHFACANPYMAFDGLARLAERLSNKIAESAHRRRLDGPNTP